MHTQPINNLPKIVSAMAVVLANNPNGSEYLALVLENEGEHVLPKGRQEAGEDIVATAIREVHEEAGVVVPLEAYRGHVTTFGFEFKRDKVYKEIQAQLFVITAPQPINVQVEEGFTSGAWLPASEAAKILTHEDARNALNLSLAIVKSEAILIG